MISLVTALASLTIAAQTPAPQDSGYVELIFLDVGQGDAVVIKSPEGKVALIDAGRTSIVHKLDGYGIDSIAIAIASHPHADHIGGMAEIVTAMPLEFYMDNGAPHTTRTYRNLLRTLRASDVTYLAATSRNLGLGSVNIEVLPPPDNLENLNDRSIGLIVEYGEFKAILTGDSQVDELNYFIALGVPDVTVLKAAHHGSRNGVTPAWLAATKPEVVVISAGAGNSYGHPHRWAMRYYQTVAKQIYRTDLHGDVIVRGWKSGKYEVSVSRVDPEL